MKQNNKFKAVRVGSSDCERLATLRANHESEELKNLLARGFKVKAKRPRIQQEKHPKKVVVSLGEVMAATITLTWEEYQKRGQGLKIVMRID